MDPYQRELQHQKITEQHAKNLARATWVLAFFTMVLAAATIANIVFHLMSGSCQ